MLTVMAIVAHVTPVPLDMLMQIADLPVQPADIVPVVAASFAVTIALEVVQSLLIAPNIADVASDIPTVTIMPPVVREGRGKPDDTDQRCGDPESRRPSYYRFHSLCAPSVLRWMGAVPIPNGAQQDL